MNWPEIKLYDRPANCGLLKRHIEEFMPKSQSDKINGDAEVEKERKVKLENRNLRTLPSNEAMRDDQRLKQLYETKRAQRSQLKKFGKNK